MFKPRYVLYILVIVVILIISFLTVSAETQTTSCIMVNNQKISSNVEPVYYNGTILVTAKELMDTLGGSFSYNPSLHTGILRKDENEIVFRLDDSVVRFNGKYMQAPAPMKVIGNRFMVPAQFTAVTLGAEVYMNTNKNTMMIFQPIDGKIVYQVVSGDSLWIISQLFGTTIGTIKQLNSLTGDIIYIGQKLVIKNYTAFNTIIPAQTSNSATLSSGAGWGYSAVNYLKTGTDISVIGKNGDWYKVITLKGNGYIYYSVMSIKQDLSDIAAESTYFNGEIPVDTTNDYVTYIKYTVQKGDTIWKIAEDNGIISTELAASNNISLSDYLYIGQMLTIPVHNIPVKATLNSQSGEVLDWFKEAQYVFPIGKSGKFIDLETGKSFIAKRTMGASHSDTETLTAQDTKAMMDIFGGSWTWKIRSFILEVDGRRIAISVAGMPHAGVDGAPYLQNIDNRSGNFGTGPNYDRIPGNNMNGHFDVYFLNCLRHVDNKIEPDHQYNVLVSGGLQ